MRVQQRIKRRLCLSVVRVRRPDHKRVRPDIEVIAEVPIYRATRVPPTRVEGKRSASGLQAHMPTLINGPPLSEPTAEQHEAPILTRRLLLHPDVVGAQAVARPFDQEAFLEVNLRTGDVGRDLESPRAPAGAKREEEGGEGAVAPHLRTRAAE